MTDDFVDAGAQVWDDYLTNTKRMKVHRIYTCSDATHENRTYRAQIEQVQGMCLRVDLARWGIIVPQEQRLCASWKPFESSDGTGDERGYLSYWAYEVSIEIVITEEMLASLDTFGSTYINVV